MCLPLKKQKAGTPATHYGPWVPSTTTPRALANSALVLRPCAEAAGLHRDCFPHSTAAALVIVGSGHGYSARCHGHSATQPHPVDQIDPNSGQPGWPRHCPSNNPCSDYKRHVLRTCRYCIPTIPKLPGHPIDQAKNRASIVVQSLCLTLRNHAAAALEHTRGVLNFFVYLYPARLCFNHELTPSGLSSCPVRLRRVYPCGHRVCPNQWH